MAAYPTRTSSTLSHIFRDTQEVPQYGCTTLMQSESSEYLSNRSSFPAPFLDSLHQAQCPSWLPSAACNMLQSDGIQRYQRGFKHLKEHFKYTVSGRASGAHGVFAK